MKMKDLDPEMRKLYAWKLIELRKYEYYDPLILLDAFEKAQKFPQLGAPETLTPTQRIVRSILSNKVFKDQEREAWLLDCLQLGDPVMEKFLCNMIDEITPLNLRQIQFRANRVLKKYGLHFIKIYKPRGLGESYYQIKVDFDIVETILSEEISFDDVTKCSEISSKK